MNSGRKDKDNKRKFFWKEFERGAKRFHSTNHITTREDFQRNGGSRWGRSHHHNFASNYHWRPHNRNNYNRYPSENDSFENHVDYTHHHSSDLPREQEEKGSVGPGSETERREKVLATKKRIEEALASKSTDINNQEINFQDSVKEIKDKTYDKSLLVSNVELRLTNSDFKEIGSVASGVVTEGEVESGNMVLNIAPCSSQQRSFDSSCPNTVSTSVSKSPRVGGWTMSAINEITTTEPVNGSNMRGIGEIFIQESREKILGNIPNTVNEENPAPPSVYRPSSSSPKHHTKNDFSKVGRLYQSFLRSRLRGYTLKMRDKTPKPLGPNPLLDKSVLENQRTENITLQKDKILELEMPLPIQVKMEDVNNIKNTQDEIAAEEANEFCKEFSFLLTHPNFLIPPEDLEKLGLGHLSEMNELINEKRKCVNETGSASENRDNFLRVRSLNALNSITENDIAFNQQLLNSPLSFSNQSIVTNLSPNIDSQSDGGVKVKEFSSRVCQQESSSHLTAQKNQSSPVQVGGQISDPQASKKQSSTTNIPEIPIAAGENTLVESVVEKVVGTLLKTSLNMQSLNTNIQSMINSSASQSGLASAQSDTLSTPPPQLQAISSKILRLFLIDKQMEDLAQEKMKIYIELLSAKEISSTLFNSWAQDQIQKGNVMSVITNTSSSVPELARMLSNEEPNANTASLPNEFCQNSVLGVITELKEEIVDPRLEMLKKMKVEASILCNPCPPVPGDLTLNNKLEEINKPKLSVRKDLHDPNASTIFLNCNPSDIPNEEAATISLTSFNNGETTIAPNSVHLSKKKKKEKVKEKKISKKKKVVLDVVNLIDDTTDEELCSVSTEISVSGIEQSVTDESSSKVKVKKTKPGNKKSKNIEFNLLGNTTTCMASLKNALFLGCKEGCLKVFSLINGKMEFSSQLHSESIMCIKIYTHSSHKIVITGSMDLTLKLFSLENRNKMQTIIVNSPVQCFDLQGTKLYVGTKTGLVVTYRIKVVEEETGELSRLTVESTQEPLKLTDSSILAVKAAKEGTRRVLIVSSRGEQISVWETSSGTRLRTFNWCDTVHCLHVYGETPLVFCGTNTQSVKVVNFITGENARDIQLSRSIIQVVFLKTVLFAACLGSKVYVYDVEDNKLLATIPVEPPLKTILCMAVEKHKIIVANNRGDVRAIAIPVELKSHLKKISSTE